MTIIFYTYHHDKKKTQELFLSFKLAPENSTTAAAVADQIIQHNLETELTIGVHWTSVLSLICAIVCTSISQLI